MMVTRREFDSHKEHVEVQFRTLSEKIDAVSSQQRTDTSNIQRSIESLGNKLQDREGHAATARWKPISFSFSVFSFVLLLFFGLYTYMQDKVEDATNAKDISHQQQLDSIRRDLKMHESDGHPAFVLQKIEALDAYMEQRLKSKDDETSSLRDKLEQQRDSLSQQMVERDSALKAELTRRVDGVGAGFSESIKSLNSDMRDLQNWQIDHGEQTARINAQQSAQIDHLQNKP